MPTFVQEAAFAFGGAVVGITAPVVLALAGTVEPSAIVVPIASAGPLGAIAGFLLLRLRERDREEREERGKAWEAVGTLRESVEKGNETLIEIRTILKERRNE